MIWYAIKRETKGVNEYYIFRGYGQGRWTMHFNPNCLQDRFDDAQNVYEMLAESNGDMYNIFSVQLNPEKGVEIE